MIKMSFITKAKQKLDASTRTTQNKISVLLVDDQNSSGSLLKKALLDHQYQITKHITFLDNLVDQIELYNPDILILGTAVPSESWLKDLAEINQSSPLPIVIFAEVDSPNVVQSAIKAGVIAYVVSEIHPHRLKSIISVAHERFKEYQSMRNELKQAKAQLESRKFIERAKGLLMQQKSISEQKAFETIRKMAMDQGNSLAMVSKNIIDVCTLLSSK